ncbi:PRC-barrel domain-containing protein [Amaricoccus sp.]|uniref:PRC-barrel domain-containing protein n=1 Tax=Amaricoccus sp. TaxID=1872485 RepID=UPI001B711235|nr:PRC-barrel domain-containing protein [Amaricoccus sp.]MBP7241489.1 PRC-barrel domain-containing protein [Amaricoccus sp.]
MLKTLFASAAFAALAVAGVQAQTQPVDPATPPAVAPMDGVTPAPLAPAADPMAPAADPLAPEGFTTVELSTISTDQLIGTNLVNHNDETIATVGDVLITDNNEVEGVVATFGGVLGFGANKVLLEPDEVQVLQDSTGALIVRTNLTPESIENRPVYEG